MRLRRLHVMNFAAVRQADIEFGPSRHLADAPASFEIFSRLKADGVLPRDARYMMALPGPLHLPLFVVTWDAALDVLPAWERFRILNVDFSGVVSE